MALDSMCRAHGSKRNGLRFDFVFGKFCLDGLDERSNVGDMGEMGGRGEVGEAGELANSDKVGEPGMITAPPNGFFNLPVLCGMGGGSIVSREALSSSWIPDNVDRSE